MEKGDEGGFSEETYNMSELFIEIGVEEIPVAELQPAAAYLSNGIKQVFESEHIAFTEPNVYFTPRRIAIHVEGLADKGKSSVTTYTGPRKEASFDKDGKPSQAAMGFARSKGVDPSALKVVKLDRGEFMQVEVEKQGVETKTLIEQQLDKTILSIPFRKSMRWGSESVRFIRPIRWLVVLYNGKVVPVSIGSVKASSYTYGLRTGSAKKIKIDDFSAWKTVMERERILPEYALRRLAIRDMADVSARKVQGQAGYTEGLLDTITNLVESPTAILGSFDPRFMNMPEEVIMSVMETHQKYIPVRDNAGRLMPYFIGINNNPYGDEALIRKGYERVLRARLEDAEFYYHHDIKQPLESYIELLKGMAFYPKLGSLYDKTERIAAIASYLCDNIKIENKSSISPFDKGGERGILPFALDAQLKDVTLRAARLCKADLATRLVSEFPELQGTIGYHYILLEDPSASVTAVAIKEHYGQPASLPGALVYIADKIDSLVGFFSIGEVPTGTQDPYGLRRAAIGILSTIAPLSPVGVPQTREGLTISIKELIDFSIGQYNHVTDKISLKNAVLDFLYTRLEGIFTDKYVQFGAVITEKEYHLKDTTNIKKLISAVIATGPDNILEADRRINALKDIVFKPDFEPVFLAFKRAVNISKGHTAGEVDTGLLVESSEKALYDKYLGVVPEINLSLEKRDYNGYIKSLEKIVPEINTFFDEVLVMDKDEVIKKNRLNLLAKIKNLVMQVVDITKLI